MTDNNASCFSPNIESTRVQQKVTHSNYHNIFRTSKSLSQLYCLTATCNWFKNFKKKHFYLAKVNFKSPFLQAGPKRKQESFLTPRAPSRARLSPPSSPTMSGGRQGSHRLAQKRDTDLNPYNQGRSVSVKHLKDGRDIIPLSVALAVSSELISHNLNSTVVTNIHTSVPGLGVSPESPQNISMMDTNLSDGGDLLAPAVLNFEQQTAVTTTDQSSGTSPAAPSSDIPASETLERISPPAPFTRASLVISETGLQSGAGQGGNGGQGGPPPQNPAGPPATGAASTATTTTCTTTTTTGMTSLGTPSTADRRPNNNTPQYWFYTTTVLFSEMIEFNPQQNSLHLNSLSPGMIVGLFDTSSYRDLCQSVANSLSIPIIDDWADPRMILEYIIHLLGQYIPGDIERKMTNDKLDADLHQPFKLLGSESERQRIIQYTQDHYNSWGFLYIRDTLLTWLNITKQMMLILEGQIDMVTRMNVYFDEVRQATTILQQRTRDLSPVTQTVTDLQQSIDHLISRHDHASKFLDLLFAWKEITIGGLLIPASFILKVEHCVVNDPTQMFNALQRAENDVFLLIDTETQSVQRSAQWEPFITASHTLQAAQDRLTALNRSISDQQRRVTGPDVSGLPPLVTRAGPRPTTAAIVSPSGTMTPVSLTNTNINVQNPVSRPIVVMPSNQPGPVQTVTTGGQPLQVAVVTHPSPQPQHQAGSVGLHPPLAPAPIPAPLDSRTVQQQIVHQVVGPSGFPQNVDTSYLHMLQLMTHYGIHIPGVHPQPHQHVQVSPAQSVQSTLPGHHPPHSVQGGHTGQGLGVGVNPPMNGVGHGHHVTPQTRADNVLAGNLGHHQGQGGQRRNARSENIVNVEDSDHAPNAPVGSRRKLVQDILSFRTQWEFPSTVQQIAGLSESDLNDHLSEVTVYIDESKTLVQSVNDFMKANSCNVTISRPVPGSPGQNFDQDATVFLRECKVFLTKVKSRYDSRLSEVRDTKKSEKQSMLKGMKERELMDLNFDSEIVPWLVQVTEKYREEQKYDGPPERLARTMMQSIKLRQGNFKMQLEKVKTSPKGIFDIFAKYKFINGFASQQYFNWQLFNKDLVMTSVPANKKRESMEIRLSKYTTVYQNLKLLEKLEDVPLDQLKWFTETMAFCEPYIDQWRQSYGYYSNCRTAEARRLCIENLRNQREVNAVNSVNNNVSLDASGNQSLRDVSSYLEYSALDIKPLDDKDNVRRNELLGPLPPSYRPVSILEFWDFSVAFAESLLAKLWQTSTGAQDSSTSFKPKSSSGSGSRYPMSTHATNEGQNSSDLPPPPPDEGQTSQQTNPSLHLASLASQSQPPEKVTADPIVTLDISIFLNKSHLAPELQNTPMPFPQESDNVRKKYKSLKCPIPDCGKSHSNGSTYFCELFMSKQLTERLRLAKLFSICNVCLCKHSDKQPCNSNITCVWCREAGRPHGHNPGLCSFGRYRYPCVRAVSLQSVNQVQNLNLNSGPNGMDDMDLGLDEPYTGVQSSFFPQNTTVIPSNSSPADVSTTSTAGTDTDDIFANLPLDYFETTRVILELLSRNIKAAKERERRDPSSIPPNPQLSGHGSGDVSTSLLASTQLTAQSAPLPDSKPEPDIHSALGRLAAGELPMYLEVHSTQKMIDFYNLILSSLPLRAEARLQTKSIFDTFSKIANLHANICTIENDNRHIITNFRTSYGEDFIVARPSNKYAKMYKTLLNKQTLIHRLFRYTTLNFGKISFQLHLNKDQINKIGAYKHIHLYHSGDGHCILTCYVLLDSGCSGLAMTSELLDILNPSRLRSINLNVQTANGNYENNSFEWSLQVLTKSGSYQSVVIQELRGEIPIGMMTPKQAALCNFDYGKVQGTPNYFDKLCQEKVAFLLIGQSHPQFRSTEVFDPRLVGFENFSVMNPRLRFFMACDLFHESFLTSGELGTDPGNADDNHFILIPSCILGKGNDVSPKYLLTDEWLMDSSKIDHSHLASVAQDSFVRIGPPSSFTHSKVEEAVAGELDFITDCCDEALKYSYQCLESSQIEFSEKSRPRSILNKTDSAQIADFIFAESTLLTPLLHCPTHQKLTRQLADNCDRCKLLNCQSSVVRDYDLYRKIFDNLSLAPDPENPGRFYPVQNLQFIDDPAFIGRLAASNFEAAKASSKRLVKRALELNCLEMLDKQMRDRISRRELILLTKKELDDVANGKIPSQFTLSNYVCAPEKSTKFRLVMNSSLPILGTTRTLATTNRAPRTESLADIFCVGLRTKIATHAVSGDICRAYLSIHYTRDNSFLFLTVWYANPAAEGTEKLYVARFVVLQFGCGQASTILSITIDKYGATKVVFPESRTALLHDKYVDNLFSLSRDIGTCAKVMGDIKNTLDGINLEVDKIFVPHYFFKEENDDVKRFLKEFNIQPCNSTVGFGYDWNLENDSWTPFIKSTIYGNIRGNPLGPSLELTDLEHVCWTRQLVSKVVPSLYDALGCMLGPLIAGAKILLTRTCKAVPLENQTENIEIFDPELAKTLKKYFNEAKRFFKEFSPLKRSCVPPGHTISHLVFSHDGSVESFASVCHIVSRNIETGSCQSAVLTAKQTCSSASPFVNECRGYTLSALHCFAVCKAGLRFFKDIEKLTIYFTTDNQPSSHVFDVADPTEMIGRSTKFTFLRICFEISNLLPQTIIKQSFLPGAEQPSDLNSKLSMRPLELCTSSLWREGSEFYLSEPMLSTFCFFLYSGDRWTYHRLPTFKGTSGKNFLELEAMYTAGELDRIPAKTFCRGKGLVSDSDNNIGLNSGLSLSDPVPENYLTPDPPSAQSTAAPRAQQSVSANSLLFSALSRTATPCHTPSAHCTLCPPKYTPESNEDNIRVTESIHPSADTMYLANIALNSDDGLGFFDIDNLLNYKTFLTSNKQSSDINLPCLVKPLWLWIIEKESNIEHDLEYSRKNFRFWTELYNSACQHSSITRARAKIISDCNQRFVNYQLNRFTRSLLCQAGENVAFIKSPYFTFPKAFYENIMFKREDLITCLNIFKCIIRFIIKCRKQNLNVPSGLSPDHFYTLITWRSVLISDQTHFTPITYRGEVRDHNSIKYVVLRAENRYCPILAKNSPLLYKFIDSMHKISTNHPPLGVVHTGQKQIYSNLFSSSFGLYSDNLKSIIKDQIFNCFGCRRTLLKHYEIPLGPRHLGLNPKSRLFSVVSIDPCMQMYIKSWPRVRMTSKGPRTDSTLFKVQLLAVLCESSAILDLVPIGGQKHDDILLGINSFEAANNCNIDVIITDAGSNLHSELLMKKSNKIVLNHGADCQRKNSVERRIGMCKNILRSIFRQFRTESKVVAPLDFLQLLYLTRLVALSVNTVPYSNPGSGLANFSPAHLRYNTGIVELFEKELGEMSFPQPTCMQKLRLHIQNIRDLRDEAAAYQALTSKDNLSKNKSWRGSTTKHVIQIGDVILYHQPSISKGLMGVVVELPTDKNSQMVTINTVSRGKLTIDKEFLFVICPKDEQGSSFYESKFSSEVERELKNRGLLE